MKFKRYITTLFFLLIAFNAFSQLNHKHYITMGRIDLSEENYSNAIHNFNMAIIAKPNDFEGYMGIVKKLPSAQPEILACGNGELVKESDDLVKDLVKDCISRKMAIDELDGFRCGTKAAWKAIEDLPSVQPEYEPVTAEDFAKTMSENTIWQFAVWHGGALALMKEQGFVICKKAM